MESGIPVLEKKVLIFLCVSYPEKVLIGIQRPRSQIFSNFKHFEIDFITCMCIVNDHYQ